MSNISFNLSGRLDSSLVEVLGVINEVANSLSLPFFVIGAMARDIVLEYCHSVRSSRGTRDLDIGIRVADWEEFRRLSAGLIGTGRFKEAREPHAFLAGSYRVDIVPFGNISGQRKTISWPPQHEVIMSTEGFHDAYDSAMALRLRDNPAFDVKVPTIPGMALLKLISWHDRYPERPKDAEDLLFMMDHYAEAGNEDRLYAKEIELLQTEGFDPVMAGIRLLGRDIAAMVSEATGESLSSILKAETREQPRNRLTEDMIKAPRLHDAFDKTFEKVKKLAQGFQENFQEKESE
jgi:predicted nucleotidyltransferase